MAEHGTGARYKQHKTDKEDACPACKEWRRLESIRVRAAAGARTGHRGPAPWAVCGSWGGISRHRRAGEKPCQVCRDFVNGKDAERRAAAKVKQ